MPKRNTGILVRVQQAPAASDAASTLGHPQSPVCHNELISFCSTWPQ